VNKYRVLVVDDSPMMRMIIKKILAPYDFLEIVDNAANGSIALEKIQADSFDLILLDIDMPVMNGVEFLRQGRSKTDAKIMVLSSAVGAGDTRASQVDGLGADAIFHKPSGSVSFDLQKKSGTAIIEKVKELLAITD